MDYLALFGLGREPFSNTPDPDFFYPAGGHAECLHLLEVSIRLGRGLNVVVGEVGLGKTTLCRRLLRSMAADSGPNGTFDVHLMLDPAAESEQAFLLSLSRIVLGDEPGLATLDLWQLKERLRAHLFEVGVDSGRTVVLVIDEGQKLGATSLEAIRELLNYETNEQKLLQVVIFGQPELKPLLARSANLTDRINFYHELKPLGLRETAGLIRHRLAAAAAMPHALARDVFTWPAVVAVLLYTGGYPRKIIKLCHKVLLAMLMFEATRADFWLVRRAAMAEPTLRAGAVFGWQKWAVAGVGALVLAVGLHWAVTGDADAPSAEATVEIYQPKVLPDDAVSAGRAEAVPKVVHNTPGPPTTLGSITIRRGESLSRLIHRVYGVYSDEYLARVRAANPHLPAPEAIDAGAVISFPAVEVNDRPLDTRFVAELYRTDQLSTAYEMVRGFLAAGQRVVLLPSHTVADGLVFGIALEEKFLTREAAHAAARAVPGAIAPAGRNVAFGEGVRRYSLHQAYTQRYRWQTDDAASSQGNAAVPNQAEQRVGDDA